MRTVQGISYFRCIPALTFAADKTHFDLFGLKYAQVHNTKWTQDFTIIKLKVLAMNATQLEGNPCDRCF